MKWLTLLAICLANIPLLAQVDTNNIQIVRDEWGVPHIFSKTDVEAVYGLAWAHAEDDFARIQEPLLASRQLLGAVKGVEGALMDAVSFLIDTEGIVNEKYETTFSPQFKRMLGAYVAALNRYASLHPKEVLHKKLFPVKEKDVIKGYVLATTFISNVQFDLGRIFQNTLDPIELNYDNLPSGSNGFAFAPSKTKDNKTYLVSNSHQPLRSFMSWYECHIQTEEGWNFLGATFCGGLTPFVGTNEHLGWTHCVNYNNYHDVYRLTMHPKQKLKYKYDGEWLELEERVFKAKVKIAGIKVGVKKKFYRSKHGPVIKNKTGFYALRFPSNMVIGAAEQWYKMNKATSWEEFWEVQKMQQHPSLSTTYTDKKGNIAFIDNGLFPARNPNYDWTKILPGDTSATLWPQVFLPMDSLLVVVNPPSGYLHHMNGSGFYCTAEECRPYSKDYITAYAQGEVARNKRVEQLMPQYDELSYEDIKTIKYDQKMAFPLYNITLQNLDLLRTLSPKEHPDLADVLAVAQKWDGETKSNNKQAAVFALAIQYILKYMGEKGIADLPGKLPVEVYPKALKFAQKHLLKHFGTLEIELGELQKHVRGDKILPIGGVPEALAAMYTVPYKKKYLESNVGDSYILFARYTQDGVEMIETINCYGASNRPESKHYSDQMDLYIEQKLKPMTLDKQLILKNAERIYHPK